MKREREDLGDRELALIYVARRLREALRVESLLTDAGVDYVVETDLFTTGLLFRRERAGAFFYAAPEHADAARGTLATAGLVPFSD